MKNLRAITNDHHDLHLLSLRAWRGASEISPRDDSGPYVIQQEGYDPLDAGMNACQFLLGRSAAWIRLADFYRLPKDERRKEFLFPTAAEALEVMMKLGVKPVVLRSDGKAPPAADDEGFGTAIEEAQRSRASGAA